MASSHWILLAAAACTHTRGPENIAELVGSEVEIETYDHRTVSAVAMNSPDGVVFRTADGNVIGFGALTTVTEVRRGMGALEGAGIGGVTGGLIGAVAGFASGDDECSEGDCILQFSAGDKAALGAIFLGAAGGLVGLVIGGIRGAHYEYAQDASVIRPIGPPGSVAGLNVPF